MVCTSAADRIASPKTKPIAQNTTKSSLNRKHHWSPPKFFQELIQYHFIYPFFFLVNKTIPSKVQFLYQLSFYIQNPPIIFNNMQVTILDFSHFYLNKHMLSNHETKKKQKIKISNNNINLNTTQMLLDLLMGLVESNK